MDVPGRALMLGEMLDAGHSVSLEQLPDLVSGCVSRAGLHELLIYVTDLEQETLRLLTGPGLDAGEGSGGTPAELPIEGTAAGKAFQYLKEVPDRPRPSHRGRSDPAVRIGTVSHGSPSNGRAVCAFRRPQSARYDERLVQCSATRHTWAATPAAGRARSGVSLRHVVASAAVR